MRMRTAAARLQPGRISDGRNNVNGEITKPEKNINGRLRDFPGIDSTLEIAGMAADSKAIGDVLRQLADGHNKQNAAIRELKGYINGMLQIGNICLALGNVDLDEKMPGK